MHKLTRRCAWVAVATVAIMALSLAAACAEPLQSKMTVEQKGERGQALARVESALDAAAVTAKLKGLGLTDEQINQRLAQLTTDELTQLASGAEAVAAGGAEPSFSTTTWLLIIVILLILAG